MEDKKRACLQCGKPIGEQELAYLWLSRRWVNHIRERKGFTHRKCADAYQQEHKNTERLLLLRERRGDDEEVSLQTVWTRVAPDADLDMPRRDRRTGHWPVSDGRPFT